MTRRPERIVDAHVHLWDPARTDWYPYLSGARELDMGDVSGMSRRFDAATYMAEAAGWNVDKLVNVAAATGGHSLEETLELDGRADSEGHPDAIVGGLVPAGSVAESVEQIEAQMAAQRFRGVRPMGATDEPVPAREVLEALGERNLVFELMAHPHQLADAAGRLAAHDDLVVVVEHAGWPRSDSAEELALWRAGMEALADLGDNVVCKISGLAMPLGSVEPDVLAPWVEHSIEVFGVDRCMFASNFPVDGLHGTLDELWRSYSKITEALDEGSRSRLFADNAERIYRC